jgi:hypothetical protein
MKRNKPYVPNGILSRVALPDRGSFLPAPLNFLSFVEELRHVDCFPDRLKPRRRTSLFCPSSRCDYASGCRSTRRVSPSNGRPRCKTDGTYQIEIAEEALTDPAATLSVLGPTSETPGRRPARRIARRRVPAQTDQGSPADAPDIVLEPLTERPDGTAAAPEDPGVCRGELGVIAGKVAAGVDVQLLGRLRGAAQSTPLASGTTDAQRLPVPDGGERAFRRAARPHRSRRADQRQCHPADGTKARRRCGSF